MIADARDHGRKIIADPYNSIVFGAGGGLEIYIVGGFTRDLLSMRSSSDRDYVVRDSMEGLVAEVVRVTHGRLIELGGEGLRRIVLRDGVTLDFTPIRENIEKDLSSRDFTINAIAWSPRTGWIDPKGGMDDLSRGLVRMVDAGNLTADPLRILRAYRFSTELSFVIEPATRAALRRLPFLLSNASGERITSEFFRILNLNNAPHTIEMMLKDGLLSCMIILPYKDLERKVKALGDLCHRSLESLLKYGINPQEIFSQGLSRSALLSLEILLEGLPEHLFVLSSRIVRRISRLYKAGEYLVGAGPGSLDRQTLFDIFEASGDATPDFLLLRGRPESMDSFEEYLRIKKKGLLSGEEISSVLGVVSGRALGNAIRAVKKAQFVGLISTAEQASDFLKASDY